MPKPKIKNNQDDNNEIKINVKGKSSVAEFTKRPLPSGKELKDFEDYVSSSAKATCLPAGTAAGKSSSAKAACLPAGTAAGKDEEIEESLSEIYKNENGDMANVKKLEIKKRHSFFFWFFSAIFTLACLAGVGYGAYYFYMQTGSDSKNIELSIEGKDEVMAGEEFFYAINFKNFERVDINNIEIRVMFPENFIFLDSEPTAGERNDAWHFDLLPPHRSDLIKIKGKLAGKANETAIILADMTYTPANFSSEFKKSASFESVIKDTGIELSFIHANSVMVGEESEIIVKYSAEKENYLNNFRLTVESFLKDSAEPTENTEFIKTDAKNLEKAKQELIKPGVWQINEISHEERDIKVKFRFNEKIADSQDLILKFEHSVGGDEPQYYLFEEEIISMEVIKSDLNLNLIINGAQSDQGIDFGQTLNYTIAYANKGESEMKDAVIMAVLESEFLDWDTLDDARDGKVQGNTISWSKEEIAGLETLEKGKEGVIEFSIKAAPLNKIDSSKDYQIKSYAQYSIGDVEGPADVPLSGAMADKDDMRSNTIINKINSDLRLNEQVRYFNDDNIAVGSGPHPPKVGETTSYKVYWALTNNLHELSDLQVLINLPHYVKWDNKNRASAGSLEYNSESHNVIWKINRMPTAVYQADAEFNISITPEQSDKNKIMVLISGTIVQAIDNETKAAINKTAKAKTTKLEDDEVAEGDGRVVE